MKTIQSFIAVAALFTAGLLRAAEPNSASASKVEASPPAPASVKAASAKEIQKPETPPKNVESLSTNAPLATNGVAFAAGPKDPNKLRMNFRDASLDLVLNYLSEAAGFVINIRSGVSVKGKVNIWSS